MKIHSRETSHFLSAASRDATSGECQVDWAGHLNLRHGMYSALRIPHRSSHGFFFLLGSERANSVLNRQVMQPRHGSTRALKVRFQTALLRTLWKNPHSEDPQRLATCYSFAVNGLCHLLPLLTPFLDDRIIGGTGRISLIQFLISASSSRYSVHSIAVLD